MSLQSFAAEVSAISQRMLLKPEDEIFDALKAASIRNHVEPNPEIRDWARKISTGTAVNPR